MRNDLIFLDRDGVINRDPDELTDKGYVTCWEEFQFLPGALEALRVLTENSFKIVIISNQAGVGRGVYTKEKLDEITERMLEEIKAKKGLIYSVRYCVHRPEDNCDCRKPNTALFTRATQGVNMDFAKSYFIGDTKRDVEAGNRIGCRTVLVLSGKVKRESETSSWEVKPDFIMNDLKEAARKISAWSKE
ncbi:MAG: HAD family hydrolase [Candidatus Omnitrophica bacterium]|nr:HAD family hydrolase [Candidatus Omnitrophota bacterium]